MPEGLAEVGVGDDRGVVREPGRGRDADAVPSRRTRSGRTARSAPPRRRRRTRVPGRRRAATTSRGGEPRSVAHVVRPRRPPARRGWRPCQPCAFAQVCWTVSVKAFGVVLPAITSCSAPPIFDSMSVVAPVVVADLGPRGDGGLQRGEGLLLQRVLRRDTVGDHRQTAGVEDPLAGLGRVQHREEGDRGVLVLGLALMCHGDAVAPTPPEARGASPKPSESSEAPFHEPPTKNTPVPLAKRAIASSLLRPS